MASFFRKRVAHKVLSILSRQQDLKVPSSPNLLSSLVKVNRFKSAEPQLVLPWKRLEQICKETISLSPTDLVRFLKNQGLPTAEGFVDIHLSESPFLSLVFTVDKHIFSKIVLLDIVNSEGNLAKNSCLFEDIEKKKIVVQCSVPSIGEVCHLTHFRSLIYTKFVSNIQKFVGHQVTTVSHVKDWGPEIAAFVHGYKQFKSKGIILHKDKNHLLEIYKAATLAYGSDMNFKMKADSIYDKMKLGDPNILSEWQHLRQECINYYESLYQRIGMHFDDYYFDSTCYKKSDDIANKLSSIILNKDGSLKTTEDFPDNTFICNVEDVPSALHNLSKHISAANEMKEKHKFDMMYYVIPSSQSDFLSSLFYMMEKLQYEWVDDLHEVTLKVISSFDSKRRKKISIDEVLDLIKEKTILKLHENMQMELNESLEEMSEELSLSSLIINDMKHRRNVDYVFQWEDIVNFKKGTAASFQFCSAGLKGLQEDSDYIFNDNTDTSALLEPQAHALITHLARFDEIVFKSYTLLEPCIIFQYLSSLWYFTDQVTNTLKLDIKSNRLRPIKARVLLLSATLKVLNTGLHILGITPLKKVYSQEKEFLHNN